MKSSRHKRSKCLYLATFDPTMGSTGTTTRGRLFLRKLLERYSVSPIHLEDAHGDGKDDGLICELEDVISVPSSRFTYFLHSPTLLRQARRRLRANEFDFVFTDFEKAESYARLLTRATGIPYVQNSHNVEYTRYADLAKKELSRIPFVPYMYCLERSTCRWAILTIAISDPDAGVFRRWVDDSRVEVVPCAFDENGIHPFYVEKQEDPPTILMVGNYRHLGNREAAHAAVRDIPPGVVAQRPDAGFRFMGRDVPTDLEHANIEVAGFVDDLLDKYAKASVVIAPICLGGGIKIKVIEALATGKYLVTTQRGMAGIDPEGLDNLKVRPSAEFLTLILEALPKPPQDDGELGHCCSEVRKRTPLGRIVRQASPGYPWDAEPAARSTDPARRETAGFCTRRLTQSRCISVSCVRNSCQWPRLP